jgi:hypothetical protein
MNPRLDHVVLALAPRLAYAYLRLLRRTMRLEYRNAAALERARAGGSRYLLAFWHSRFLMMPWAYPDRRLVVLHSRSRDARILAGVLERFGLESAWGSSSAGAVAGLRELLRRTREGYDVGLAPDGPRGPRRQAKPGVVAAARLTGLPIVPVGFSASRARRLASWDRTLVPWPFSRGLFVYGEPLSVPPGSSDAEREALRGRLERELDRLTDHADAEVGLDLESSREAGAG